MRVRVAVSNMNILTRAKQGEQRQICLHSDLLCTAVCWIEMGCKRRNKMLSLDKLSLWQKKGTLRKETKETLICPVLMK